MSEQGYKRYGPSDRKLQHLRAQGIHPSSRMLSLLLASACSLGVLWALGRKFILGPLAELAGLSFTSFDMPAAALPQYMARALTVAGVAVLPIGLAGLGGWLVGNWLQSRFALRWPWSRPSGPTLYTFPRRLPADVAVRGILSALLLLAAGFAMGDMCQAVVGFPLTSDSDICRMAGMCLQSALTTFCPALLAVVLFDVVWSRYSYVAAAGMTETERRREAEETGTSRLTRWRRARLRRHGGRR